MLISDTAAFLISPDPPASLLAGRRSRVTNEFAIPFSYARKAPPEVQPKVERSPSESEVIRFSSERERAILDCRAIETLLVECERVRNVAAVN
jgi:hypothetical protein